MGLEPPAPSARQAGPAPDTHAPDGSEIRLLTGLGDLVQRASLCEVSLGPGRTSRPVRHRTVEEIWYVLSGRGHVWRAPPEPGSHREGIIDVVAGDALTIPRGWSFQFAATGDEPLRFLCYTSPPWPGNEEAAPVAAGGLGQPSV